MTALPEEVQEAQAEGADIRTLMAPDHIELDENGKVRAFWAQPQIISAVQRGGRTGVRSADKPAVRIPCDYVVVLCAGVGKCFCGRRRGFRACYRDSCCRGRKSGL